MLSYVHELLYKPMCFSPSSPLREACLKSMSLRVDVLKEHVFKRVYLNILSLRVDVLKEHVFKRGCALKTCL